MANQVFTIQGKVATSVANTFTQLALPTGLTGLDTTAFRIKELIVEHPLLDTAPAFGNSQLQITRGTKAAVADYADTSLLVRLTRAYQASGAAYIMQYNPVDDLVPQSDIIIVETQLYLGVKTLGFVGVATFNYKMLLEEVKITADQRISILSSRLP
jgi:hypothetical protein